MQSDGVSRRHFFYGALLAGAVPPRRFRQHPFAQTLGYKSPNEKLNIAAIGAGRQGRQRHRGLPGRKHRRHGRSRRQARRKNFQAFPKVPKYKDFRRMFDKERQRHRRRARVLPRPHARQRRDVGHGARQTRLLPEAADAHRLGGAATGAGGGEIQGRHPDGQPGLLAARRARVLPRSSGTATSATSHEVHAWTNRPDPYWPQGPDVVPEEKRRCRPLSIGKRGWPAADARPTARPTCRTTGAAFPISAAAPSAIWPATFWARPTWRCASARPPASNASSVEGKAKYTFPYRTALRFDFPARGAMPPVKVFWHDGLTAQPKIRRRAGWRIAGRQRHQRQPLHRRQGHGHHRLLRRAHAPGAGGKNEGLQAAAANAHAQPRILPGLGARPLPRLAPRLQGRRPRLLEFQRLRPVRAVDAAGRDRHARARASWNGTRRTCASPTTPRPTSSSAPNSTKAGSSRSPVGQAIAFRRLPTRRWPDEIPDATSP